MNNRWKMNRMGLINFWLYDEEIFYFADGKLLLRGQNGAGKSITTQSFIPFILDGDRTPSRLDPFGSSDRKMEFYFLGEEERDEATGYLFLEFKKEDTEQYRTIGIGQRAKKGAPMGFWGFVLTDGRRIGYDLSLYKELGSTKIPHSKQDLKKILGPDTLFTDMPGEYKSLVNKYIFGFPRMEQYEQFIRLLVKVRAPKLSKEFKPTNVYDILNESLQTLTDEDLRAMVDAMEKMDTIQNSLEHLREAYGDVRKIQSEYTRYNQFMLAQKAKAYLDEKELLLKQEELTALEQEISSYQGAGENLRIRKILDECRENRRSVLREKQECAEKQEQETRELLSEKDEKLRQLQETTDWEPERKAAVIVSRKKLEAAGIPAVPFYQAVEFLPEMEQGERDLLEAQLKDAGLLDALVVAGKNRRRMEAEFPEFCDCMIVVSEEEGHTPFPNLMVNEELPEELKIETHRILQNITEENTNGTGLILRTDGFFSNGILKGRSRAEGAAVFIGALERKRRLEQEIEGLKEEIARLEERLDILEKEQKELIGCQMRLEKEYVEAPDSAELDRILEKKKQCLWYLEREQRELEQAEREQGSLADEKNRCMQKVIQICRNLPYFRTYTDYQDAEDTGADYADALKRALSERTSLEQQLELQKSEKEKQEQNEEYLDNALWECTQKKRERDLLAVAMREAEEYLNRPENREIAHRLKALTREIEENRQQTGEIKNRLAVIQNDFERISKERMQEKSELADKIVLETTLQRYFEEELALKLVLEKGEKTLLWCAKEALQQLRENDRNRNASEITTVLYRVFQQHSSSLVRYGTALEDCFSDEETALLRKRQRITSVWNGKKLYFSAFCQMLKNSIEETELLIQQKDRELFEDILSRILSQQLTDRIGESREWIKQICPP